jgi:hypothetical protein
LCDVTRKEVVMKGGEMVALRGQMRREVKCRRKERRQVREDKPE